MQIFSERCSGSNFVEAFLRVNCPSIRFSRRYGFKHWLRESFLEAAEFPDDMLFLVIIRSPFNWLRSMHQRPWHAAPELRNLDFSEFIRRQWKCVWCEEGGISRDHPKWGRELEFERNPLRDGARFANILEVRRVKYAMWDARLRAAPGYLQVNFDHFVDDPMRLLQGMGKDVLAATRKPVRIPPGYKGRLSWKRRLALVLSCGRIGAYRRKPRKPICEKDVDFILHELDLEQERHWGFDLEALADAEKRYSRMESSSVPGK